MRFSSLLFLIGMAGFALSACAAPAQPTVRASIGAIEAVNAGNNEGFERVVTPRPFVFPIDHGPHPTFQTEWWYYTGNLTAENGRRFGFQLTFFRRALTPDPPARESAWAASEIYMAHFALSDIDGDRFYAFERFSRAAADLAGASGDPFRVFLHDWSVEGIGPEGMTMRLYAAQDGVAIDLTVVNSRPPVLQGNAGVSQKGSQIGNASAYYSLTRMVSNGVIRIGEETYQVSGLTWMDREWGTSALEEGLTGWDWFALQLESGHDLMYYQLREADGSPSPFVGGSLLLPDNTVIILGPGDVELSVTDTWRSPRSGAVYPSGWRLRIPDYGIDLIVTPALRDQELPVTVVYWEGAVEVSGSIRGRGYVELTGYADAN
ncbi:lipocalin-like domain-containing protein [Chloroflexus sp.]|uniref:lipocalin-like domain-containing protein n=1 Tax=Chloroflexus sp. TaxID=1904827 RepID=UPI00261D6739|nr:lipocalin-like domain-containing protein [uncultured Chloroflexus sp.]